MFWMILLTTFHVFYLVYMYFFFYYLLLSCFSNHSFLIEDLGFLWLWSLLWGRATKPVVFGSSANFWGYVFPLCRIYGPFIIIKSPRVRKYIQTSGKKSFRRRMHLPKFSRMKWPADVGTRCETGGTPFCARILVKIDWRLVPETECFV